MSLEANSNKAEDIMDVTPSEVERVMREHGVSQMIHGHTHRPKRHDLANGTRWVLGDWDRSGWAIKAETGKLELYSFPINTGS
jgi:UDP-2,3-diacylglucosamine hydrolase